MAGAGAVGASAITAWMTATADVIAQQRDHLTHLDAAIGDGDHGTNMDRGFTAVREALAGLEADARPGAVLTLAGKTLVSKVGGASGPLWGTALRRAGRALGDAEEVDGPALAAALDAALGAVTELGAAQAGDKTMVDALAPAVAALHASLDAGASLADAADAAASAAEEGAQATTPLQARKGRASYLGERSVGHEDPGAHSTGLVLRALHGALAAAA